MRYPVETYNGRKAQHGARSRTPDNTLSPPAWRENPCHIVFFLSMDLPDTWRMISEKNRVSNIGRLFPWPHGLDQAGAWPPDPFNLIS